MALILLDVDGVVADCTSSVLRKVNARFRMNSYGYKFNPLTEDDITSFNMMDPKKCIFTYNECKFVSRLFSTPGFVYKMKPVALALRGIQAMEKAGHEVVFLTSIWRESDVWAAERLRWLEEHVGKNDVVFTHNKKLVPGDVFIDDRLEHVRTYKAAHPDSLVLLYTRPWNHEFDSKTDEDKNIEQFTWLDLDDLLESLKES